jgi:tetratricopeptide (TPR) repeat protein
LEIPFARLFQSLLDSVNSQINFYRGDSKMDDKSFNDQGVAFHSARRFEEAVTYYKKAIEINCFDATYHENLGNAYSCLDEVETNSSGKREKYYNSKAINSWGIALLLDPSRLYLASTIQRWKEKTIFPIYDQSTSEGFFKSYGKEQYSAAIQYIDKLIMNSQKEHSYEGPLYTNFRTQYPNTMKIRYPDDVIQYAIAYSRTKNYEKAKFYLNLFLDEFSKAHFSSGRGFSLEKAECVGSAVRGYYERGLIHQLEGDSASAIEDFERAIELSTKKYNETYIEACIALEKEKPKIKLNEEKANKIVAEARMLYSKNDLLKAKEIFLNASRLTRKNEFVCLHLALFFVKENHYDEALKYVQQFLKLVSFDNLYYKAMKSLEECIEKRKLAYRNWVADIKNQLPAEVLRQAKNSIIANGMLKKEKEKKLIKCLEFYIQDLEIPSENYGILLIELVKIIKQHLIHKPNGKSGAGNLLLKFSAKILAIEIPIQTAIGVASQTTSSSHNHEAIKALEAIDSFKQVHQEINQAVQSLEQILKENVVEEKKFVEETPPPKPSKNSSKGEEAEKKHSKSKSKSSIGSKSPSSAPKIKESLEKKSSSSSANLTIERLKEKRHALESAAKDLSKEKEEKQAKEEKIAFDLAQRKLEEEKRKEQAEQEKRNELKTALTQINLARKNNSLSLSELNQKYIELETKAILQKSIEFFMSRAEFYDESAEKDNNSIRKTTLYTKALEDYKKVMSYDPFLEGIPERIEAIETKLKNPQKFGESSQIIHKPAASVPAPKDLPLKREDLTPEQLQELEAMKAQLKKEKGL